LQSEIQPFPPCKWAHSMQKYFLWMNPYEFRKYLDLPLYRKTHRGGIRHLSIKEDLNIQVKNCWLSSLKAHFRYFLLTKIDLEKHVILAISILSSTKLYLPLIKRW
jgi:hypothetical protein